MGGVYCAAVVTRACLQAVTNTRHNGDRRHTDYGLPVSDHTRYTVPAQQLLVMHHRLACYAAGIGERAHGSVPAGVPA